MAKRRVWIGATSTMLNGTRFELSGGVLSDD